VVNVRQLPQRFFYLLQIAQCSIRVFHLLETAQCGIRLVSMLRTRVSKVQIPDQQEMFMNFMQKDIFRSSTKLINDNRCDRVFLHHC